MNCKCGIKALFFEKTTSDGTFNIFKCDTQETKKKVKCDLYYSQKIKDPVILDTPDTTQTYLYTEVNPSETYMKDLNRYIYLLKNATLLPKEYSTDYIANINYILRRLNKKFYFEDTESIESLETRIKNNEYIPSRPDTTSIKFPLKLTEYPPELSVPLKTKSKKKEKTKSREKIKKLDLKNFIVEEEISKQGDEDDNKSDFTENSNESSDENKDDDDNDNTFDIDDYNSDVDETFDDTGAFSD